MFDEDFGHIVRSAPAEVATAESAEDVVRAIRSATERGLKVAARGSGHSTYGRALAPGGVVLDLSPLGAAVVDGEQLRVGAGATWRDVLAVTLSHGLAPPVLPDYLDLSVGGTIVVGGVGAMTATRGAISDHVLELEVVTGTGVTVTCSASANPELFDAMRGGLAQAGVITRATLALVPAPAAVRVRSFEYEHLADLLADAPRYETAQGTITAAGDGWAYQLDIVEDDPSGVPYLEYLSRLDKLEAALRANGQWAFPHPWLLTFIGAGAAEGIVGFELHALDPPRDLGPFGQVVLSPLRRSVISTPHLRLPEEERFYAFNLIRIPTSDDPAEARRLVAANAATFARVRAAGGTLYPVSAIPPGALRGHRAALAAAKRTFDPAGTLTPGY